MTTLDGRGEGPGGPPYAAFLSLGFELVAPMLLGLLVGHYLDRWLGTKPWFLIGALLAGMVTGFVGFLRRVLPPRGSGGGGSNP